MFSNTLLASKTLSDTKLRKKNNLFVLSPLFFYSLWSVNLVVRPGFFPSLFSVFCKEKSVVWWCFPSPTICGFLSNLLTDVCQSFSKVTFYILSEKYIYNRTRCVDKPKFLLTYTFYFFFIVNQIVKWYQMLYGSISWACSYKVGNSSLVNLQVNDIRTI